MSHSESIKRRVLGANEQEYKKVHDRTKTIFTKYISPQSQKRQIKNTLLRSETLIIDLLYAIKRGCDFIYVGEIPNLSPYSKDLPPELYIPLQQLFSSITTNNLFIPSPISVISKKEVKKFSALIDSDIYAKYSESQAELKSLSISAVANNIKLNAEKLVASNPTLLGLYNNIASLLPLSKLIQPKIGELGTAIYESINQANHSNTEKNLVIYRYKDVSLNHFSSQYKISMNRFEDDLKTWIIEGLKEALRKRLTWKETKMFITSYLDNMKKNKLR